MPVRSFRLVWICMDLWKFLWDVYRYRISQIYLRFWNLQVFYACFCNFLHAALNHFWWFLHLLLMVSPSIHNHRLEAAADAASEKCRSRRVSIKIMVPQKVPHHQPTVMFLKVKHDSFYHFLSCGFNDMLNRFVSKGAVPSWERSLWNSENHHIPNRYPSIGTLIFTLYIFTIPNQQNQRNSCR